MAHKDTLFLLIPTNGEAEAALAHPANSQYVSSFSQLTPRGLEVGFHVASVPSRVVATVGRNGDLKLQGSHVSRVHIAFEMHQETLMVLLSVKAKDVKSVTIHRQVGAQPGAVKGDCVLSYGVEYGLTIAQYTFRVSWKPVSSETLRDLAIQGYHDARGRRIHLDPADWVTEPAHQRHPWYETRCDIPGMTEPRLREAVGMPRDKVGRGASASVYRAVNEQSGNYFAIKTVARKTPVEALSVSDRFKHEVNILSELKHENIIKLLGHAELPNGIIEIHLPLHPGNLRSIIMAPDWRQEDDDKLCKSTLSQMLCALDYLAVRGVCHRDVKPENILCLPRPTGGHHFELADFELAVHISKAEGHCGSKTYQAPESHPSGKFPLSPKMDVWSLFATIADIHHQFDEFPPPPNASYSNVRRSIVAIAQAWPDFADMVQENPDLRVSAAELLLTNFNGEGLTTPVAEAEKQRAEKQREERARLLEEAQNAPEQLLLGNGDQDDEIMTDNDTWLSGAYTPGPEIDSIRESLAPITPITPIMPNEPPLEVDDLDKLREAVAASRHNKRVETRLLFAGPSSSYRVKKSNAANSRKERTKTHVTGRRSPMTRPVRRGTKKGKEPMRRSARLLTPGPESSPWSVTPGSASFGEAPSPMTAGSLVLPYASLPGHWAPGNQQ